MKKQKRQTWKSMAKKVKVPCTGETVELQEDRNLFARMMVICKSRPESDIRKLSEHTNLVWFHDRCLLQTGQCYTAQPRVH